MQETSEISEIVASLKTTKFRLTGIDGTDGSGKSTLAKHLSSQLGFAHINLDDHLEKNRGQFVKYIKYDQVKGEIDKAKQPIVIEGVCLLAAIENLTDPLGILIYVKRVSDYGMWYDKEDCEVNEDIDEFIIRKKSGGSIPALTEEIIRYHYKYKPYEKAGIIYKRIDR
jgi:uridine kinase